ncbi:GGDEF domain-containing protein [Catenuloplanes japonicus]|uniref:GGDEF domain-containing protein n=1 Tax=Catenuloplanes japonicus TaxID=33876 RepID=UPI00068E435E|nr:GGDEF domain-containing protein [Catenuloplanes japonicus]
MLPATTFLVIAVIAAVELLQAAAVGLLLRRLIRRLAALSASVGIDRLTGSPGRGGLHDTYRALAATGAPPVVLLLDLTGFKEINDQYGHDAGDDVLRAVATRLATLAAEFGAVAGRLGGDEFVLLLPGHTAPDDLTALVDAIRAAVGSPIRVGDNGQTVTVSCVVGAARPATGADPAQPFRTADIALYHARHHHLPWAMHHPGMTHPATGGRHGARLRDQRPMPAVLLDTTRYRHLVAGEVSSDVAHRDDIAEFHQLLEVLAPLSRDFGTDVADLVTFAVTHGAITLRYPVTGLAIQPITRGEARDGGFLVLAEISRTITLTSPQIRARAFVDATDVPMRILEVIAETADRLHTNFRALRQSGQADR